jgi:hypothetical protein
MANSITSVLDYLRTLTSTQRELLLGLGGAGIGAVSGALLLNRAPKTGAVLGSGIGGALGLTLGSSMDDGGVRGKVKQFENWRKRAGLKTIPERLLGLVEGISGSRG